MGTDTNTAGCYILQDENAIEKLEARHFDPDHWQDKPGFERIQGGRGGSVKINIAGRSAILRRYLRGGMIARWVTDRYLWTGRSRTRAWREWSMLKLAIEAELPVPTPLGVCVCRDGLLYRAAIITAYIKHSETLAERLTHTALDYESWCRLGLLLRQFQEQCFRHVDLNANNLLIDHRGQFYIIDFDKARMMDKLSDWQWSPLGRLRRSLEKIDRQQKLYYGSADWQALIDGYQTV